MNRLARCLLLWCVVYSLPPFGQDAKGQGRQDTGLDDPSVNPGQAAGLRVIRGEVKQASPKAIVIEDRKGKQTTMSVDAATAGDRDIRPGDTITSTITGQGRAVAIHKETAANPDSATHNAEVDQPIRKKPRVP